VLLQVMDHGTLTDNNGRKADFRNVIIVMTTNAGAETMNKSTIGFTNAREQGDEMADIKRLFTPEFRNRLDAVITFAGLPPEIITKVVEKFVFQLEAQLADRGVTIELSEEAARWLAETGYDEKFGARPLARVIQEHIKKPLADELLFGKLLHGGTVRVLVAGEGEERKLAFEYISAEPKPKKAKGDSDEDDDDSEDEDEESAALVEATPRKALPGPRDKKDRPKSSGTVPSVPRRKDD
jgi:ATP-dependent Clp protease ATP-binding subunit ClpA